MSRILLTGATSPTGNRLLRLLIEDPRVSNIIVPTQRALPAMKKVTNPVEDDLTDVLSPLSESIDYVFCCLDATRRQAGSREAFIHANYTLVIDTALAGLRLGARHMLVVSTSHARAHSLSFYRRVKGEMENALRQQGWPRLTIIRPTMTPAMHQQTRSSKTPFSWLSALLPAGWRPVTPAEVAGVMYQQAFLAGRAPLTIIESADIRALAAK